MIELMVVVIIIGILAAFAIPQYLLSAENSKATSAVAQMKMVGAANRMYNIDNSHYVQSGQIVSGSAACSNNSTYPTTDLVGCNYLPVSDYSNMAYAIAAEAGNTTYASCPGGASGNLVACAVRVTGGPNGTYAGAVYSSWGYTMDVNGVVSCCASGACSTNQCGSAGSPPTPPQ
jgi:type II secretory pathway pseudopilin PulG